MSYCRMSDESDVYAYRTHEARMKDGLYCESSPVFTINFSNSVKKVHTLKEFKETLLSLRTLGYRVPDEAINRIDREMSSSEL